MKKEDLTFIRLKCTVSYNDERTKRFYWRDPIGDHSGNIILLAERLQLNGNWKIVYENQTLVGPTPGVQGVPVRPYTYRAPG